MSPDAGKYKSSRKKICSNWAQKGKCAFGALCNLRHPVEYSGSQDYRKQARGDATTETEPSASKRDKKPSKSSKAKAAPTPVPPRTPSPLSDDNRDTCHFFLRGMCNDDDDCGYRHVDPNAKKKPVNDAGEQLEPSVSTAPQPEPAPLVCKEFAATGQCRNAYRCKNLHPEDESRPSSRASSRASTRPSSRASTIVSGHRNHDSSAVEDTDDASESDGSVVDHRRYVQPFRGKKKASAYAQEDDQGVRRQNYRSPPPPFATDHTPSPISTHTPAQTHFHPQSPPMTLVHNTALIPDPAPVQMQSQPQLQPTAIPVPHISQASFHWSAFADPYADGNVAFCKQLTQNNCVLQGQCRFRHSLTPAEFGMLFKDQQPILMTLAQAPAVAPGLVAPTAYVSPGPYSQPTYHQPPLPPPVSAGPPVPPSTATAVAPSPSPEPEPAEKKKPKKKICDFYILNKCKNGKKCPFAHVGSPIDSPHPSDRDDRDTDRERPSRDPAQTVCRYMKRDGACKLGSRCEFSHVLSEELRQYSKRTRADGRGGSSRGAEEEPRPWASTSARTLKLKCGDDRGEYENGGRVGNVDDVDDDGWGSKGQYPVWSEAEKTEDVQQKWDQDDGRDGAEKWGFSINQPHADQDSGSSKRDSRGTWVNNHGNDNGSGSSYGSGTPTGSSHPGLCYDYMNGACLRARCRFSHGNERGSGSRRGRDDNEGYVRKENRGECRWYKQGKCDKGDSCRYMHVDGPDGGNNAATNDQWEASGWGTGSQTTGWGTGGWDARPNGGDGEEEKPGGWAEDEGKAPAAHNGQLEIQGGLDWAQDVEDEDRVGHQAQDVVHENPLEQSTVKEVDQRKLEEVAHHQLNEHEGGRSTNMEPEEQTVNFESSWKEDNAWPEQEEGHANDMPRKRKGRGPCLKFGQGLCRKGDACEYDHILPEDQVEYHREGDMTGRPLADESQETTQRADEEVEEQCENRSPSPEIQEVHPIVERYHFACSVSYDAQCQPKDILTGADSKTVIISNLPKDVAPDAIRGLVETYGEVTKLTGGAARFTFEFLRAIDAMQAFQGLSGYSFSGKTLATRLESTANVYVCFYPHNSSILSVTWPSPTTYGWVFYKSITSAKEAEKKINGQKYQERTLKAKSKKEGNFYALRIDGLPPSAGKPDVETICPDSSYSMISMAPGPSYTGSPKDYIKADIEKNGGAIFSFEYSDERSVSETVAYATLQLPAGAVTAVAALNGAKPQYLGGDGVLKAQHIYLSRYSGLPKAFEVTRDQFNLIKENYKSKCKIIDFNLGEEHHIIQITAAVAQSTTFLEASTRIQSLLGGQVVTSEDGTPVWDDYFSSTSGSNAVSKLNSKPTDIPYFIYPDQRQQLIRVYGAPDAQEVARGTVLKLLKNVNTARHEISVPRLKIAPLLENALGGIQKDIGDNKVSLDVATSKLIIKGREEDLRKAQQVLDAMLPLPSSNIARSKLCPLCEQVPIVPIKLNCRHVYCKTCLKFALTATVKGEAPPFFSCVFPSTSSPALNGTNNQTESSTNSVCGVRLPYTVVRDILRLQDEATYLKLSFGGFVRANPDKYFFCPTPNCPSVYRSGLERITVRCSQCSGDICPCCRSWSHEGRSCGSEAAS